MLEVSTYSWSPVLGFKKWDFMKCHELYLFLPIENSTQFVYLFSMLHTLKYTFKGIAGVFE